ncbi:His/Gly/Thr/Pro-type tRNA ligase C-terminal domain-containing protein [Streptomyces variabilis]
MGAGLPYWLPDGAVVRHTLEEYVREAERAAGYRHVYSPVLGKRELYELSGHWDHYRDDMYPPMDVGGEQMQIDFHQPERFGLRYIGPDGARHRPVMVHRSVIGSVERAVAHLLEEHGGAFPPWLAPLQLVALPVGEEQEEHAHAVVREAAALGLRAEVGGLAEGSLGARIRRARLVPYQAVLGAREAADGLLAVRLRDGRRPGVLPVAEFLRRVEGRVRARGTALWEPA